jgi:hypothetical protein
MQSELEKPATNDERAKIGSLATHLFYETYQSHVEDIDEQGIFSLDADIPPQAHRQSMDQHVFFACANRQVG